MNLCKGVKVEQTANQVKSNIEWVEAAMKAAYDFSAGEGLKENEGHASFVGKVSLSSRFQSMHNLNASLLIHYLRWRLYVHFLYA